MSTNIAAAYQEVKKFNEIAGNLALQYNEADMDSIGNQLDFIREELEETTEAFIHDDAVELLDGACDLFVTVAGLLQKLELNGMKVEEALARVNENNLDKFPTLEEFEKNPAMCPPNGEPIDGLFGRVVFKREYDGKVLKPTTYTAVNIEDCVPEGFFGVGEEF